MYTIILSKTNFFTHKVRASWCLRAKSRSGTACDVEIIEFKKTNKKKQQRNL